MVSTCCEVPIPTPPNPPAESCCSLFLRSHCISLCCCCTLPCHYACSSLGLNWATLIFVVGSETVIPYCQPHGSLVILGLGLCTWKVGWSGSEDG